MSMKFVVTWATTISVIKRMSNFMLLVVVVFVIVGLLIFFEVFVVWFEDCVFAIVLVIIEFQCHHRLLVQIHSIFSLRSCIRQLHLSVVLMLKQLFIKINTLVHLPFFLSFGLRHSSLPLVLSRFVRSMWFLDRPYFLGIGSFFHDDGCFIFMDAPDILGIPSQILNYGIRSISFPIIIPVSLEEQWLVCIFTKIWHF